MPLPWFRRKKAQEQAPEQAAALTDTQQDTQPVTDTAPVAETGEPGAPRKRRRGSRGGRGRKRPAGAEAAAVEEKPARAKPKAEPARKPERKEPAKRRERPQQRRRTPQKRAPLPQAKRELLVSVDAGEKRVAVLEDDRVAEVYLERPERRSIAGNIYKGVVDNVLPGMEAAFVEIGLEKNGFLFVDEIVGPELEGRKGARKIQDLISRGQEVLVQAVKDPMKTKGARLTTEISLPGRFVVYQPLGEGLGVSRRLEDDERQRLKEIVKAIVPQPKGGIIVRTAAEGASAEDIERDLVFLSRLWKSIEARAKAVKSPALVYQEAELPLRVIRDLFTGDFERAFVDHDRTHKRIIGYLKKTSPHMVERVIRHKEADLFGTFGVQAEIESTLSRRIDLPSGGYLVFDYAEAFTVIDVNTGRFVGSRSRSSGARLEDTITKNNLEAVKEVVRQLRLRDIGGIIVIDFIDMANPKNRATVEEALRSELERDRTKTYVVEISPLGLVEMTRQNVTDGPREVMTKKCPTCGGDGIVVSERTTAVELERKLRALAAPGARSKAFRVELNAKIASMLVGPGAARLAEIEDVTKKRFFLVAKEDVHLDHFLVLEQGTLAKLQPKAPADEGAELELKLVEVGLHDPEAGVAKLDGVDVCVGGASKLIGKKVKLRIVRVLDGQLFAELVEPATKDDEPLTAEAEAEKPTRAVRRKVAAEPEAAVAGDESAEAGEAEPDELEEIELEEMEEIEEPAETDQADGEGEQAAGATPKKRTRRGSRGGRRRKKPAAKAAAEGADATEAVGEPDAEPPVEPEPEPAAEPATGPRIHLPDESLGRDEEPEAGEELSENGAEPRPRKKTRRGSRGGRSRRKKVADATESANGEVEAAAEPESVSEPEPEPEPQPEPGPAEGDEGYVPMSEWIDDFERAERARNR